MEYIIRVYKIQTIVVLFSILVFYIFSCIESQLTPKVRVWGSPAFFSICWLLYFEIIILPMNTLYLFCLKFIKANHVNIYSSRNIAIFTILYELIWCMNVHIVQDAGEWLWKLFLINYCTLTFILAVTNIVFVIKNRFSK